MEKKKILVVDDEENITTLFKLIIEKTGKYEVEAVTSGSTAFAFARQYKPDLILLDIMMPDMDGGEVASQMKTDEETRDIPIVFVSAAITKEEAKKQNTIQGGYPIIAKPVPTEELLAAVEKYTLKKTANNNTSFVPLSKNTDEQASTDRRRYQRVETPGLLSYTCMDEQGTPVEEGMGNALNVSQGGLQLETHEAVYPGQIHLITSSVNDELIDAYGRVVYSREIGPNQFLTGINFLDHNENTREFVVELIKAINMHNTKDKPN